MAECGERVEDFVQMKSHLDKNASFSSSKNSSFSPCAGFDSSSEAKANSELQKKESGQPKFCALCGLTFNSEFQMQQHLRGKVHLNRVKHLSNESSFTASGLNQNTSHAEMTNERMYEPFGKKKAKRMVDDTERNQQSKKPRLFMDAASQPKCNQLHLFEKLYHKTPLALLNACRKGLVVVCKRHGSPRDLSFTASLELNGKTYSETGNSRKMAKQLLVETVLSEREQEIEKMHVKRTAMNRAVHSRDETGESLSAAGQEVLQSPPPFDTAARGSDHVDFTSNDDRCSGTQSSTFDSVYTSAYGQQFESSSSITPTSDKRKLEESEVNIEDSAVSSAESLNFSKGNAQQRPEIMIKMTAFAILNDLVPGIKWNVTKNSRVTVGSPLKEFVVSIETNGKHFEGCSRAIYLARQYAAETALNKMFGLEFRRDAGMPVFHGKLADITCLKKGKLKNTHFLDIHGNNPVIALNKLFKGEVSFKFHPHYASESGLKQSCTLSVAGMTFEGCDRFRKNARKRAASAAVAVLRANGMYDQKAAELKARPTGVPVRQSMAKQRDPSSAISVRSMPVAHTKSHPLPPAACTKSDPLPVSAIARLNRVFPESRFVFQPAEKIDLNSKGKIVTVDLLIGDQKFVGKGRKPRHARVDASKKALRACGLWGDLDGQAQAQLHVPPEIKKKIHEKQMARGQGKDCAARGSTGNYNCLSIESSYFGTENFDNSCFGHSDSQGRGISEGSYRNNYTPIDVNYYDPEDRQASFMGSEIERGNDSEGNGNLSDGNHYGTGNKQARFIGSGVERGYNKNSDIPIRGRYYGTRNEQVRFMSSGVEGGYNKNSDIPSRGNYYGIRNEHDRFLDSEVERGYNQNSNIPIRGNYYGTRNEHDRFMDSGVERGYNTNSDISIRGNYYDTGDEQVRFLGSGIERRNDNSSNILIDTNFYDTDDRHASFVGSGVSFARRNEGAPSVNRNNSHRLLNRAGGIPTQSSVPDFLTDYQNNEYEFKRFSSY